MPPNFAVTVPFWGPVTGVVLIENVFFVAPAGTVTLAGIVAEINVSLMETTGRLPERDSRAPAYHYGLAPCNGRLIEAQRGR